MKEDIKLPAIIDNVGYNQKVLIFKCGKAYHLEGDYEGEWSNGEYYIESQCKNITQEYLANTYGKVESKEHAEFIVELAKNAGLSVFTPASSVNHFIIKDGLSFHNCEKIKSTELKQITIPLPPKQIQTATSEEEFEMQQIMKNNGDNLVLGCEDSNCEEWPKVGDEVLICDLEPDSRNIEFENEKVNVIAKTDDARGTVLTISHKWKGIGAVMFKKNHVKKPKTPEEELRDELDECISDFQCQYHEREDIEYERLAGYILSKYNITKKPQ